MKIVISNIPGYFPNGYPEQLYLDVRSVGNVKDYFFAETADKFKITNDESYRKRKIQTVFYDKYTIEFTATESIDIGLLNIGETISIVQDSGEIHLAELLDFQEPVKMQNSEFLLYNITYRDLNTKNTVNHLTYNSSDNPDFSSELYIRKKIGESFEIIKSKVFSDFSVTEYNRTSDDSNYIDQVSSESAFKTITYHAYLNEDDKNTILNYVNAQIITGSITGTNPYAYIKFNGTNYEPLEVPIITIDKGELEGIYYVTVTISYEQILNYPYVPIESISADPNVLRFTLDGGTDNSTITYTGVGDWLIVSSDAWITTVKSGNNLEVTVGANGTRNGEILLESSEDSDVNIIIQIRQSDL